MPTCRGCCQRVARALVAHLVQKRLAREAKELEKLEKAAAKVGRGRRASGGTHNLRILLSCLHVRPDYCVGQ